MIALVLTAILALGQEGEATEERRTSWYVLPNAAFDTDDGFGVGLRAELAFHGEGHAPYKSAWMAQGYTAWSGYHHHRLRWDRVGLGRRHRLRLTTHLAWRQWLHDGYWGLGNGTAVEAAYDQDFDADDPRGDRYHYSLFQPFAHITLRQDLRDDSPWSVFAALNPKLSTVRAFEGSLLEAQAPHGMEGGLAVQLMGGVLYDTREPEIAPHRGVLLELSGRWSPPLHREAGGFGGVLASGRAFAPLGGRLTVAARLMGEWLGGSVPFYEMAHWGGAVPIASGSELLRGTPFGRWRAPGKALLNTELRWVVLEHQAFKRPVQWELAPFADVGAVFGADDTATAAAPSLPVHPSVGLGVRPIFDEIMVGRLDVAVGADLVERGGAVVMDPSLGFYLMFEHPF